MIKKHYKCTKCGLEVAIIKEEGHDLPKAECQNCGTMTLKEVKLYQLHHQDKKDHHKTEMVCSFEVKDEEDYIEVFEPIMTEMQKKHLLPEGMMWMVCNESSPLFWKMAISNSCPEPKT